jgi:hypothetical protein
MKHEAIAALHKDLYKRRQEGYVRRVDCVDSEEPTYSITLSEMNTFIRALEVAVKALEAAQSVDDI